jgi:phenylpyruvate tautomerase PptA (4-oxalocrotonate tautomerase family)
LTAASLQGKIATPRQAKQNLADRLTTAVNKTAT